MLSPTLIGELKDIVGQDGVVDDPAMLAAYAGDAAGAPEVVVLPKTPGEVGRVLALTFDAGVPVRPRGAGTGLTGGAAPCESGVVLSTARLARVVSVSPEDLVAVVQAGLATETFQARMEARGLFYPPDRGWERPSTLGGDVGQSASGLRAIKYRGTRSYVLGMNVALPTGEVVRTGARTLKCVTGYDLARLFTGSLGTLGVCTDLYLKLLPLPEARVTVVAFFETPAQAARASTRILEAGILPSILELLDRRSLDVIRPAASRVFPPGTDSALLMETDGFRAAAEGHATHLEKICGTSGARSVRRLEGRDAESAWRARRSVFSSLSANRPSILLEDVRVPRSRTAPLLDALSGIREEFGVEMAVYGHVAEGRLHPVLLADLTRPTEADRVRRAVARVAEAALSLDGTLGPEGGVGLGGRIFLEAGTAPERRALLDNLKRAFDPKGLMNPGIRL